MVNMWAYHNWITESRRKMKEFNIPFNKPCFEGKELVYLPLLITVIYMVTVLSVFSRCYEINDNIGILWDIKSNCMVSFMSTLLGKILSFCYFNISDIIPWYGLTLYTFLGVSIYLVILSAWKLERLGYMLIPFLTMFLVLFLRHVVRIDYSAVSIMLATGSLLGLLIYLEKTDRKHFLPVIILGICFSFSYHIRISGIKAALCFAAPAALLGAIRVRKDYRYLLVFIIPLAIAIPADHLCRKSLETESDIRFNEWNSLRGQFHGFPVQAINQDNEKIRNVNNWSQNDYSLLAKWMYFDENKYNVDTLSSIFRYSLPLPSMSEKVPFSLISQNFICLLKTYPVHLCSLAFITLLGFIMLGLKGGITALIYLGYIFLGAMYMIIFFRFPSRIGFPIILSCIIWMMYLVFSSEKRRPGWIKSRIKWSIFGGLIFIGFAFADIRGIELAFANIRGLRDIVRTNRVRQEIYHENIKELEEMNAEFFLIQQGLGLCHKFADPLKNYNFNFEIVPSGWPIFSPRFYKTLRKIGMEHAYEIFPRLANDEGGFVVVNEKSVTQISIYLWETYGLRCRLIPVKRLSNQSIVYKVESL